MARKRMLDPSIWADESFGKLSPLAQIMFIGLISNADDEGRLPGDPIYLFATILPYKSARNSQKIAILAEILQKMTSILQYSVNSNKFLQFTKWKTYQSINKPSLSKYPPLPEDYRSPTVGLPPNRIEKNRIEKKLDDKKYRPVSNVDKKSKEPSEKQLIYRRIIGHLQETLNMKVTTWDKQCKAIKIMLDVGYNETQIIKTIDYMAYKDEFYSDKGFDMMTVAKQIPIYKARLRQEEIT